MNEELFLVLELREGKLTFKIVKRGKVDFFIVRQKIACSAVPMFNGLKQCNHPSSFVLSYASKILNERKIFRVRAENASMPYLSFSWQDQPTRTEPNGRWRFPQKKK
jgi:hypothetical protein